jgi:hypothetical protein
VPLHVLSPSVPTMKTVVKNSYSESISTFIDRTVQAEARGNEGEHPHPSVPPSQRETLGATQNPVPRKGRVGSIPTFGTPGSRLALTFAGDVRRSARSGR